MAFNTQDPIFGDM